MKIGDTNEVKIMVTDEITATAAGSGALRVFGTPFLVAAMENESAIFIQSGAAWSFGNIHWIDNGEIRDAFLPEVYRLWGI